MINKRVGFVFALLLKRIDFDGASGTWTQWTDDTVRTTVPLPAPSGKLPASFGGPGGRHSWWRRPPSPRAARTCC